MFRKGDRVVIITKEGDIISKGKIHSVVNPLDDDERYYMVDQDGVRRDGFKEGNLVVDKEYNRKKNLKKLLE